MMLGMWINRSLLLLAMTLPVIGCGGGGDTTSGPGGAGGSGGGSGGSGAGTFTVAPHPPVPQVVSWGGPVLKDPKVKLIRYADDPLAADEDTFLTQLAASQYWTQIASEYGVGAITVLPSIDRATNAPAALDETTLLDELDANVSGANPPWGAPDKDTIYTFVIDKDTAYDGDGACCMDYDGYHYEVTVGGVLVPFAIVCQCPGFDGPNVPDVDQLTIVMSHELVEAASDPYPGTDPAFASTDDDHAAWTVFNGGENADMCLFEAQSYLNVPGIDHMVQRSWSNVEALADKDPCLPAIQSPYFNSTPVLDDTITIDYYGPWVTKGVKIPVGQQKAVEVKLWSAVPTSGPWTVTAYDDSAFFGGNPLLEFTWDKTTGQNGDTLMLTIKVLSKDTFINGEMFYIESELDGTIHVWAGVVGN